MAKLTSVRDEAWQALTQEWQESVQPLWQSLTHTSTVAKELFPAWNSETWNDWKPPVEFLNSALLGNVEVTTAQLAATAPKDPRLALPGSDALRLPLVLTYPRAGSLLLETPKASGGETDAFTAMNALIFRLLAG